MSAVETPWMTVAEVADYARSGRADVLAALNDESLRGYQSKAGGKWRVHRADVDAWLRGQAPAPVDASFTRRSA